MLGEELAAVVSRNVRDALAEDVGAGDLTASLIDAEAVAGAKIVAREQLVLAGQAWVDEVFRQLDDSVIVDWYVRDGDTADAKDVVCKLVGNTRALLTGERTALNFLQTLSATATITAQYVREIESTGATILDTRKTLPGLRQAQKYAVRCGGGGNHRAGLFDAILIKENHVKSSGGITNAIERAQAGADDVPIEIEVESLEELTQALDANAPRILLDNFSIEDLTRAVQINAAYGYVKAELEASGNITLENVRQIAATGVDFISIGALTKNVCAADLSMLLGIN